MEVKSYKKKQNNIYEVTFSNGEKYNLYDDIILKYELLINKSISPSTLKKIINDNNKKDVYYKALKYISIRMRSKKEMRDYLKKYEYSPSEISFSLESLQKDGYLDDKVYAKAYVNDQINLGSVVLIKLYQEMKKKLNNIFHSLIYYKNIDTTDKNELEEILESLNVSIKLMSVSESELILDYEKYRDFRIMIRSSKPQIIVTKKVIILKKRIDRIWF